MQAAILRQARAQYRQLDRHFGSLTPAAAESPLPGSGWSTRQVVLHLWAWQQRSIARLQAAAEKREPTFPSWAKAGEDDTHAINARILAAYGDTTWPAALKQWASGYRKFISLGQVFSELEFLDSDVFPWLGGYSLADVYLGSYEHHLEHFQAMR